MHTHWSGSAGLAAPSASPTKLGHHSGGGSGSQRGQAPLVLTLAATPPASASQLENKYNKERLPLQKQRAEKLKQVPFFWAKVISSWPDYDECKSGAHPASCSFWRGGTSRASSPVRFAGRRHSVGTYAAPLPSAADIDDALVAELVSVRPTLHKASSTPHFKASKVRSIDRYVPSGFRSPMDRRRSARLSALTLMTSAMAGTSSSSSARATTSTCVPALLDDARPGPPAQALPALTARAIRARPARVHPCLSSLHVCFAGQPAVHKVPQEKPGP